MKVKAMMLKFKIDEMNYDLRFMNYIYENELYF